ncbi:MAG: alpha-amylase family glycosyl hydrolase [Candidatus Sumerlaeaceae bacterium]
MSRQSASKLAHSKAATLPGYLRIGMVFFAVLAGVAVAQPVVTTSTREAGKYDVGFRLSAPGAKSVHVAGEFNGWSTDATPMTRGGADVFATTVSLTKGEHPYKFVLNGSEWKEDPENPKKTEDGQGGNNSVVNVPSSGAGTLAREVGNAGSRTGVSAPRPKVELLPGGKGKVTFEFKAPGAQKVYVAGTFNGWVGNKDEMLKSGDTFTTTILLDNDDYAYKFVVNGTDWKQDPDNVETEDDGNGGKNSVVRVGAAAGFKISEEKVGDGKILSDALHHDPASIDYFNLLQDGSIVIKVRAAAHDVEFAGIEIGGTGLGMQPEYEDERFQYFRTKLEEGGRYADVPALKPPHTFSYEFTLHDKGPREHLDIRGATSCRVAPADEPAGSPFIRTVAANDIFSTPDWARSVVWYEIFPERFRNGDPKNDPKVGMRKWTSDWWTRAEDGTETGPAMEMGVFSRRYGGDLQGCLEKLPYLKELGVGAVWFNPVFQSESLHKYDAQDFRHIDEHFGTMGDWEKANAKEDLLDPKTWTWTESDKLFLEYVKRAHAMGMKVIIDGVFNHTGTLHPAFVDLKKNGKASRFANWYQVKSWEPFEYEGWAGFGGLPVLREDENGFVDPGLREHIKSITRRWMDPNGDGNPEDGIDGWRLDVPNEVSGKFWSEWRAVVKGVNPNAIILGEIWDPPAKWLKGDQFDAVMNYQMAKALTRFITNSGKASDLQQDWARMLHLVPEQSNYVMMNLMDSHDTDRLVSQLFNPGRQFDAANRQQEQQHKTYSSQKPRPEVYQKMKQLVAVQFCYVGSPMIYYGDEAGMWSADDPEDRKPMLWKDLQPYEKPEENHVMDDVFAYFQRCAAIRNSVQALNTGDYEPLLADDAARVFAFRRFNDKESVIIATNDSGEVREVTVPVQAEYWNAGTTGGAQPAGVKGYVDLVTDPAVTVAPANGEGSARTTVQVGASTKTVQPGADGKLKLKLEPHTTAILLRQ